jgi:hypothetical protein
MMRKSILALLTAAAVGLVSLTAASAHGGGGGGHGGGGGGHGGGGGGHGGGGFHGGGFGFHGGGFRGGFGRRGFVGFGFGPYYDGYYPYDYNGYYDDGGCYLVRRRVKTRHHGWRIRRVEICQ